MQYLTFSSVTEIKGQCSTVSLINHKANLKFFKFIRSKGSVLVDYFVELSDTGRQISTQQMKKLFHESLNDVVSQSESSEERETENQDPEEKPKKMLQLGKFIVDPKYTDFIGEYFMHYN